MSKQGHTPTQIEELLLNPYVRFCTNKSITFTDNFKIKSLALDKNIPFSKDIF